LELWSRLQFQSWEQAERLFQPGLRDAIGASLLAQALESDLIVWQATKPKIISAHSTGATAVVMFLAHSETGVVTPTSISFERTDGHWLVSYFSLLDEALQRTVQTRAQAQIEPLATKASPEAVRQGFNAAALQSSYLERRLRPTAAEGHGVAAAGKP
jgi:hypothetical protein